MKFAVAELRNNRNSDMAGSDGSLIEMAILFFLSGQLVSDLAGLHFID